MLLVWKLYVLQMTRTRWRVHRCETGSWYIQINKRAHGKISPFNVCKKHFYTCQKYKNVSTLTRIKLWFTCSVFEIMLNCRPTSCWNMGGPKQCILSKTAMSTLSVKHLALWGGQVKVGSASWIEISLNARWLLLLLLWNHFYSWGTNFRGFRG